MQIESLRPQDVPNRLQEFSPDVRAAVLVDAAGGLVAGTGDEPEELAGLVRRLVGEIDAVDGEPAEQLEAQVDGGAVFLTRDARYVLVVVARKAALSSLMLFDQRALLAAAER